MPGLLVPRHFGHGGRRVLLRYQYRPNLHQLVDISALASWFAAPSACI